MGIPAPAGISASGLPPPGDQASAVVTGTFTAVGPGQPFGFRGNVNISIWGGDTPAGLFLVVPVIGGETGSAVASVGSTLNTVLLPRGSTVSAYLGSSPNPIYSFALPVVTYLGTVNLNQPQITISSAAAGLTSNNLLGAAVSGPGIPAGTTVTAILQPPIAATGQSPGQSGIYQLSAQPTGSVPAVPQLNAYQFALSNTGITTNLAADFNGVVVGSGINFTGSVQLEFSYDGGYTWLVAIFPNSLTKPIIATGTPISFNFINECSEVLYRLNCTALSAGSIIWRMSENGGAAESLDFTVYG
jgi:hypothetical protein